MNIHNINPVKTRDHQRVTEHIPSSRRLSAHSICALILMTLSTAGLAQVPGTTAVGTGASWTSHGGTLDGIRFSALTDVTTSNAATLQLERSLQTGVNGSHMGAPLVVGSTLYVVTPFPNKLIAYDLTTGATKWTFTPSVNHYAFGVNCCDTVNRGPAYAATGTGTGLIVYTTLDDTVIAVRDDATTGTQVWRTTLADVKTGVTTNGSVLIVPNKASVGNSIVVVGSSSGEMAVRGWLQALDLATGRLMWKAYTTGPDSDVLIDGTYNAFYAKDRGTDLGKSSWNQGAGDIWQQGGSSVWNNVTYDAANDLLFYGTSQPGTWNADQRLGENKWGASIFARRASTGKTQWIYQTTPHDMFDFDAVSESTPLNLNTPIVTPDQVAHTQVLVHFDKNGFVYTFDRLSGQILSAIKFGANPATVNWADAINLTTGYPVPGWDAASDLQAGYPVGVGKNKETHQGVVTNNICPSALGLKGWEPSAFSPSQNLFYVPTFNFCMSYEGLQTEFIAGAPYMGSNTSFSGGPGTNPASPGPGGWFMTELVAWDFVNGQRLWAKPEMAAIYSGVLSTAGNVVFYGTLAGDFVAIDGTAAGGGRELFRTKLTDVAPNTSGYACSSVGSPIAFTGTDGKQRIAVFSGVGWLAGSFTASGKGCPGNTGAELATATNGGGRVHIFKLP